ncbi:hypothetical protein B0H65DRAFT_184549 [Neurospora tetraspora]|uniref:Protein-tyrosine-phosphatase n=1 Tax=Neurospora tetraspora TaxID=94610 RepID=A0AAE0JEF6_9PEZI|nr:hypothetical protein B0H65DRAFT_184549 [Neurospora tetraspora]
MATIALPRPLESHRSSSNIGSISSTLTLAPTTHPAPIPNKHIPVCPPGSVAVSQDDANTPPPSPWPVTNGADEDSSPHSLLYPPHRFHHVDSGDLSIYKIDAADVVAALDYLSRQPLPDPAHVFPWYHGLHPRNQVQQHFFIARKRALRKTPSCLRGITIVKADGDLNISRLKGAIAPHEFLHLGGAEFIDVDPVEGFSVRNFQIQAAKAAMTSDIIVYGDDEVAVRKLGWDIASAQHKWRYKHELQRHWVPEYNTFICLSPFDEFEKNHREIVAVDSTGNLTGNVLDFINQERLEMYLMTQASEIALNVWMGPTPDPIIEEDNGYHIQIECSDMGRANTCAAFLQALAEDELGDVPETVHFDFPSSGSFLVPNYSHAEADALLDTCKWIWHLSHGTRSEKSSDPGRERSRPPPSPRKILIHCADGYTESTVLGIAYYSYSTGLPIPEAWLKLHTIMKRNFFAYPSDVSFLAAIAPRLLQESPIGADRSLAQVTELVRNEPKWWTGFDGSLPSRILDYMYLGNLTHANNPDLLRAMGIGQILSVGEMAMWRDGELQEWGEENTCIVRGVQDNGIDPLTDEFERCLEFIDRGRRLGTATLVHCRVGVSRSATICIAEVMRSMGMSFPRAYCFVRARRLNVIIQPHLRFAYELLKWEELLRSHQETKDHGNYTLTADGKEDDESSSEGQGIKRELEWGEIAREVALMNKPYSSSR